MNEVLPVASSTSQAVPEPSVARVPLIELRDIRKTYVRGDVATEVLHGISLDIHAGGMVAIMGASGSGKSTLMNLIGLLDRPTSGSYRFAGQEVSELDPDRRSLLRREAFGFIFQQYNLLATATATENVEVPAIYAGLPHARRATRAREILTTLGLGERLDHRPSQLSGDPQQRVSIARALMNGGSVILADEPTGALDSKSGEEVMRLLHGLNEAGHTVLHPVGTYVLVNNVPFQVICVMAAKGASPGGSDQDDIAFTPLTTGTLRLFGQRYVRTITVQVEDVARIDETQEAIRRLLIARHKTEDFQIRNMASILEAATETQNTLTILLGSIAAISLLVGGIGVMNIMLVSVTERTREIGIRMATGARRFNILLQFNTEALVVCAIGGLIGVLAGLGAAWGFGQLRRPVMFSAGPVMLAFGCAFATGLLFGYLPARKAANLDPVVALAAD
jgi:ABC-type lipoprotein export system ATPase subunit